MKKCKIENTLLFNGQYFFINDIIDITFSRRDEFYYIRGRINQLIFDPLNESLLLLDTSKHFNFSNEEILISNITTLTKVSLQSERTT